MTSIIQTTSSNENTQPVILAVDDDSVIRIHVKSSLESNYQVISAAAGKEALQILDSNNVNLIIIDVDMPEMSGLDLYEKIKQNKSLKNIPVIFLTGVEDEDILKKVKATNIDYILKPISTFALVSLVHNLLENKNTTT